MLPSSSSSSTYHRRHTISIMNLVHPNEYTSHNNNVMSQFNSKLKIGDEKKWKQKITIISI